MIPSLFHTLGQMFFPHHCHWCGHDLENRKVMLCFSCMRELPKTRFSSIANNPVEKIFNGRLHIHAATSAFYFSKGASLQKLIHELKYKENQAAGKYLGRLLGAEMLGSERFQNIDMIVPMPMHKTKEKKRGYNQATCIGVGLSDVLGIPLKTDGIQKMKATETQTKKDRAARWLNTSDVFQVCDKHIFEHKRILLIDDVVTTGASLEACGSEILKSNGASLFLATIAVA